MADNCMELQNLSIQPQTAASLDFHHALEELGWDGARLISASKDLGRPTHFEGLEQPMS